MLQRLAKYSDWSDFLLRLGLGVMFIFAGYGKLFAAPGVAGFSGMLAGVGVPAPLFFAYLVGVVEFVGGAFLILGLFTRWSALLLTVILAVALLTVHWPNDGFANMNSLKTFALFAATLSVLFSGARKGNLSLKWFGKEW